MLFLLVLFVWLAFGFWLVGKLNDQLLKVRLIVPFVFILDFFLYSVFSAALWPIWEGAEKLARYLGVYEAMGDLWWIPSAVVLFMVVVASFVSTLIYASDKAALRAIPK